MIRRSTILMGLCGLAMGWPALAGAAPRGEPSVPSLRAAVQRDITRGFELPDLSVESVRIELGRECRPAAPLFYVTARITNSGAAVPAKATTLVYAVDARAETWGNGVGLPALDPGVSEIVRFPVYFLRAQPDAMAGPHEFVIKVRGGAYEESNTKNNRFGPVRVTIPRSLCDSITSE